ncbi:MAG TPA: PAS domain-containing protein [Burkholderiales bacterium]|nr:PAS domain-containing protein [Burkholderiales bacterium]
MRTRWSALVVALLAVCAALALRAALTPWLGERVPYITLFGAVIVAAWYGGAAPAFAAALAGWIGAELLLIRPVGWTYRGAPQLVEACAYFLSTALIAALGGAMQTARARLEASELRFRGFMENSPTLVYLKDEQGRYVFANQAGREFLGRDDWEGRTDAELLPAAAAQRIQANDRRVLELDRAATFDLRMPGAEGERRFHSTKFPLRGADGRRYVGVVTVDVTEQRRSEAELQLVTDTMSAGMVRVSADLRYVWANRVFAAWAGLTPQEMIGRPVVDVIGEDGMRALRPYVGQLMAGRRVEYERLAHFARLGPRWIYSVAEPTFGEDGRANGWVAVISDIHERKQAQEALRESDRRKDEFLAMLAHELRNPLAPIRNAVALLSRQRGLAPEAEWSRAVIDRQVDQMTRLIDDLLDIARITSGKLLLRREPVALNAVIDLALETSRPHLDAAQQRLELRLAAGEAWLHGDRTRLAQVFSNLLNNAAKYTPSGGTVTLATRREGGELVCTVADTGRGFPPELAEHLFDAFAQWDAGHTTGGLGIGLALVRGIVALHGGSVGAQSDGAGKGSRFTVRLPSIEAAVAPPAPAAPASGEACVRVLVADDNRDAADSLARLLGAYGHEVRVAYDGLSAIQLFDQFAPDVAVLDIGMPGADGYEVARRLRAKHGAAPHLIALTGWGQEHDRARALAEGFDKHLTKPADPAAVQALIVTFCSAVRGSAGCS